MTYGGELVRRSSKHFLLATLLGLALIATACPQQAEEPDTEASPQAKRGGTLNVELSEPGSLDPPHADDSEEIIIVKNVFEGLVTYDDATAEVRPGTATKWSANADNTVWTFTLRKDNKFSNGEAVTAESFVRGWTRGTSQAEEAELAYHLAGIQGYKEHNEDGAPALSGVKAKDASTLEVTLSAPDPEFAVKVGHVAFMPVPSDAVIAGQKPSWAEFPIGNGPFMLKGPEPWKHNQEVRLVPNPDYKGGSKSPLLDEVVFKILADFDTAYLEWQAGNLDWTRIPPPKLAEAESQNQGKTIKKPTTGLTYLDIITTKAPLDNRKLRQAISAAIDRDGINKAVFNGLQAPATGIIPTGMPGSRSSGPCKYCKYDPAQAKKLFEESGVKLPLKVQLHFNAGAGHEQWVQAVADNLKTNLGIEAELVGRQPFSEHLKFLNSDAAAGLARLAWGMDYPTPQNFLFPLFGTESIGHDNYSQYSNKEFDDLLKKAGTIKDNDDRIEVYQSAEDIILEDMPVAPLWFRVQFRLVRKDKFGGLDMNIFEFPTLTTAFVKS